MKFKMLIITVLLALCVFPALAQGTVNTVSFNGFSFNYDSTLATTLTISQFAGDAPDAQLPGGPEVRHNEFQLNSDDPTTANIVNVGGTIRVYQTADFAPFAYAQGQLQSLQTLLTAHADLTPFMTPDASVAPNQLPFMPQMTGTQTVVARAQYVETPSVRGISYVTILRLDVSPFTSGEFIYTFQGISTDGTQYVSVIFGVNASMFPAEVPSDFDFTAFNNGYNDYLIQSVNQLNQAAPEAFAPSIPAIDALIQSFSFGTSTGGTGVVIAPTATVVPTAIDDPTFGGLAGVTWTLVFYGAPEAPQAVLPNAPITIGFSATGVAGNSGCNGYGGAFVYNNGALTISNVAGTLMACADDINAQEAAYLAALTSATSYQIANGQLQIAYNGGVLVFADALMLTPTITPTILPTATP